MQKIVLCLIAFIIAASACYCDELRLDKETKYQKQIMQIGFRILNANQIEKRMTFYYDTSKSVNAKTYLSSKSIHINKGLLPFMDSDDEIAAILSHEISHTINAHKGLWKRIIMSGRPKTYELKEDKQAVDLMVNAGYNPVALIIALNKTTPEPNWFERSMTQPEGSRRLISIYDYIYGKYPEYLIDNEYKKNIYYQNFLLTTKAERRKIREKHSSSTVPVKNSKSK